VFEFVFLDLELLIGEYLYLLGVQCNEYLVEVLDTLDLLVLGYSYTALLIVRSRYLIASSYTLSFI
jgi:hypothetical protein